MDTFSIFLGSCFFFIASFAYLIFSNLRFLRFSFFLISFNRGLAYSSISESISSELCSLMSPMSISSRLGAASSLTLFLLGMSSPSLSLTYWLLAYICSFKLNLGMSKSDSASDSPSILVCLNAKKLLPISLSESVIESHYSSSPMS